MKTATYSSRPQAQAHVHITCSPAEAFALITDVDRLPEWNALIERVLVRWSAPKPSSRVRCGRSRCASKAWLG